MSVDVTNSGEFAASLSWSVEDDPYGYIAQVVAGDQLSAALSALGGGNTEEDATQALQDAMHTTQLARLLERRAAVQVVTLRETHKLSWRQIANTLLGDPEKQSSIRRMYESGRRDIGL
ncbi:hypothetical protein EES45_36250 [Streptomyces sp. ADI97-07]|uniref:hypothetical protein n=1 Tax=Streptomyces sp. ADI97-07 TaxID=1522762 RepID=UPI000F54F9C2|nr:hypothetical protein [Streptomyces sp. ADI97-07]RPK69974.1 hypothetical protein EES45_36250 [Streptomyces sp. ADI97-07]